MNARSARHGALTRSLAFAAALGLGLGGSAALVAQQDFSNVEFDVTHVSGNVYVLISGRGGNIGVSSGPDGTLIVDDQFAPLADKIRAALRGIGQSDAAAEVSFLLNTHWHGDHTGGNAEFGDEATIIAHANVRQRLATPQNRGGQVTPAAPDEALPVITFEDVVSVHFNGEEIRAQHLPNGHTDGDAVIYFSGSNVVHMGDDFFANAFPFVDIASGGSVEGLENGISWVLQNAPRNAAIIPGHGPVSTVEDLELYHRMLRETIAMVRQKMDDGMSVEQIQAEGVSDDWAGWGDGFISTERWLGTVFQSLSGSADGDYLDHGHSHPEAGSEGEDHSHPHTHGSSHG